MKKTKNKNKLLNSKYYSWNKSTGEKEDSKISPESRIKQRKIKGTIRKLKV